MQSVVDALVSEVGHLEDANWHEDQALCAADALAKAEYENDNLRALGEKIGDVDNHNRATAYASSARRVAAAMHHLVAGAATTDYPDGGSLLAEASGDERIETADGATAIYALIELVVQEVAEDARVSRETADQREQSIGMYQRDANLADADGTVWIPIMAGQAGVTRETLTTEPSAKEWAMEFATDVASIASSPEDYADEDDIAAMQGAITKDVVCEAIASVVLGQGSIPLQPLKEAFFDDALTQCEELIGESAFYTDEDDLREYEEQCSNAAKRLLKTGREFAAALTAYAALLQAFRPKSVN